MQAAELRLRLGPATTALDCSARGFLGNGNWNRAEKWCYSQLLTDHYNYLLLHEFIIEIIGKPKLRAKTEDKTEKFIKDV